MLGSDSNKEYILYKSMLLQPLKGEKYNESMFLGLKKRNKMMILTFEYFIHMIIIGNLLELFLCEETFFTYQTPTIMLI